MLCSYRDRITCRGCYSGCRCPAAFLINSEEPGRHRPHDNYRVSQSSTYQCCTDIPMQPASLDIWDKKYRLKRKDGEPVDRDHRRHLPARRPGAGRGRGHAGTARALVRASFCGRCATVPSRPGASSPMPAPWNTNPPPPPSTAPCPAPCRFHGRHPRQGARGRPDAEGRLRHRLRVLHPAPAGAPMSPAPAPIPPARCRSWISTTRCVSPCPLPAADAVRRWPPSMSAIRMCMDFIRAKREDGRLRQFNLSLLITTRIHGGRQERRRLAAGVSRSPRRKQTMATRSERRTAQVVWREWPLPRAIRRQQCRARWPARSTRPFRRGACGT